MDFALISEKEIKAFLFYLLIQSQQEVYISKRRGLFHNEIKAVLFQKREPYSINIQKIVIIF